MENKKVPASYRIALGQIKRYFGDSKPTEKEVKKIAVDIAKRNKLEDIEFFMKWSLGQIGIVNEARMMFDDNLSVPFYGDVKNIKDFDIINNNINIIVQKLKVKIRFITINSDSKITYNTETYRLSSKQLKILLNEFNQFELSSNENNYITLFM